MPRDSTTSRSAVHGLYAIADVGILARRRLHPIAFVEALISARPAAVQLRAKDAPANETLALLRELAPICHRAGVPIAANDRPDLAVLAGCDIVHVGQRDMPIERVHVVAPELGVGVSTHTIEQLATALAARPTYVAFGPVFETSSKKEPDPVVGEAGLRAAHAYAVSQRVPLVAIGGVTLERAHMLVGITDAVAVIAGLLPPMNRFDEPQVAADVLCAVAKRARLLHELFVARAVDVGTAP